MMTAQRSSMSIRREHHINVLEASSGIVGVSPSLRADRAETLVDGLPRAHRLFPGRAKS